MILRKKAKVKMNIIIYTKNGCGYCDLAKKWLKENGFTYKEKRINDDEERQALYESWGKNVQTVPQIFINGKRIGGYTDLIASGIKEEKQVTFNSDF